VLVFALHAYSISLFIPLKWPYLPPLPESATLRLATLVIIGIGLIILLIAWFGLGTGPSLGLDKNKLKTGGLYRYSRNPQLVGYGLILIAFTLMYLSWYSIGWLIQFLIVSYFMVRSEEEFLTLKYEEEYKNYCKEVPRIIRLH
jgi:protein-S-isoprenylcysteine O-methyltransferase Ste14